MKYVTWANNKVEKINNQVRKIIYKNPNQFEEGESIVLKEACNDHNNRDEIKILNLKESSKLGLNCWVINKEINILKAESIKDYTKLLMARKKEAITNRSLWKKYYELLDMFTTYQYNHATTVHSAQGSTYDNSIVDVSLILKCSEDIQDKLSYTAITRTANYNFLT